MMDIQTAQRQATTVLNPNFQRSVAAIFVALLFGILTITGCAAQTAPATQTPGLTRQATTLTPTVAPTPSPSPTNPPFTRCQEIIDAQLPKDFLTEGAIIFEGECEGKQGLYKLSAATQKIKPFLDSVVKDTDYVDFSVSPDHQWIIVKAHVNNGRGWTNWLIVSGENDNATIWYPENRNWDELPVWLGNQQLSIRLWRAFDFTDVLLNPFTGRLNYHYFQDKGALFNDRGQVYYDSKLTRALHIEADSNNYVLKNIQTGDEIWHSTSDFAQAVYAGEHQWSPDDSQVSFPIWEDKNSDLFRFMVISRNGKEIVSNPIESFGYRGFFDQANVSFGWSNDGKYIRYWNGIKSGSNQLSLWNPNTGESTNLGFITQDNDPGYPIFSPDESKFILDARIQSDESSESTNYLMDIPSGKVSLLDIPLYPLTWLKTSQEITIPKKDPLPRSPTNGTGVKQVCLQTKQTDSNPKLAGGLVLIQNDFLYLLRFGNKPNRLTDVEFLPSMHAYISPNRKWLVYESSDKDSKNHFWLYQLRRKATEILQKYTAYSDDSRYYVTDVLGWHTNEELWVASGYSILFNPFKDIFREPPKSKDSPVGYCIDDHFCSEVDYSGFEEYDSNFELWMYATAGGYALIDKDVNVLWKRNNVLAGFNMPKWQVGYQKLGIPIVKNDKDVFGEHYEIFTIDRDGHQTQLTNYAAAYPTMTIDKFSWSPDGRYIAFWGDTHSRENIAQQNPYRLFVLDTVTRQTIDYCVNGNFANRYNDRNYAPVWSPDGSQMAVDGLLDGRRQILIVDFAAGTVTPVAEGELVGWMAEP